MEAAIEGRADKKTLDWVSYTIAGRARAIDPKELRTWYAMYKSLYRREEALEKIEKGEETEQRILVEFS